MFARRTVVKGIAGLPLAAVLADPMLAKAAADSLETVSLTTPSGRKVSAALAVPAATPAPTVLLIHEWWGLNDQIKTMAAELAKEGYVALAVDLMNGQVATSPDQARAQTQSVKADEATETLVSWIGWLKQYPRGNGKVATLGWCFGGGWSLNASLATPVDATVIYYGRVDKTADQLQPLKGPVRGHFGNKDTSITPAMVDGFEKALQQAGKPHQIYRYDADHAFANPTGNRYDREDAQLAWQRTLDFLGKTVRTA